MKHTKGPWKVDGKRGLWIEPIGMEAQTTDDGSTSMSINKGSQIYTPTKRGIAEAQANARLIAAAPEMIKFIHEFAQFLNAHQYEDKKILKGYTLAANLGEKATEFSTRAANIITKATQP